MTTRPFSRPLLALALSGAMTVGLSSASATAESSLVAPAPVDGASGIGDPYWPLDGNGGVDVTSYAVANRYGLASKRLRGRTTVRLVATSDLASFSHDFLLEEDRVTVD